METVTLYCLPGTPKNDVIPLGPEARFQFEEPLATAMSAPATGPPRASFTCMVIGYTVVGTVRFSLDVTVVVVVATPTPWKSTAMLYVDEGTRSESHPPALVTDSFTGEEPFTCTVTPAPGSGTPFASSTFIHSSLPGKVRARSAARRVEAPPFSIVLELRKRAFPTVWATTAVPLTITSGVRG